MLLLGNEKKTYIYEGKTRILLLITIAINIFNRFNAKQTV
jgi:hypothetical protein